MIGKRASSGKVASRNQNDRSVNFSLRPYPAACANFNQLGFRVPFVVISPFAKPHYVSHTIGDHTSMLAFIEQRFLPNGSHLTLRDQNANRLQDMFDFNHSPSLNAVIGTAPAPVRGEHSCP